MYLIIDDWDEVILGYCEDKELAEKVSDIHEYCSGHSSYVHYCNKITEASIPSIIYACVHHSKHGDAIITYRNPSEDIKEACYRSEVTVDNIDQTTYVYFTIDARTDESRDELEDRISAKMFLILKEKGVR